MSNSVYFLGIDVAPHELGLVLVEPGGAVAASMQRAYAGQVKDQSHDPQDWWRAVRTGIKELLRRCQHGSQEIRAVGITGPNDAAVLLDRAGKVLCPSIVGSRDDLAPFVEELVAAVGGRNLANLTGGISFTGCAATKLLWVRANERRVWHDLASVLAPRDFIRFRLAGTRITDPSTAAASRLFNPRNRIWSKQLLGQLQFAPEWFPTVHHGSHISGRVSEAAARETGLSAGIPVVTGASDRVSAALAAGACTAGATVVELGGAGSVLTVTGAARRDPRQRLACGCHCLDNLWTAEADGLADGATLDWFLAQVAPAEVQQARRNRKEPLDLLAEIAASTPPGADGLFFLPPGPERPGAFAGLTLRHTRSHLLRAALESGAFAVSALLPQIMAAEPAGGPLAVIGPGAACGLWCQMMADALGREVACHRDPLIAARGAAILASPATGLYKDALAAVRAMVHADAVLAPRPAAHQAYAGHLPLQQTLGTCLRSAFAPAETAADAPEDETP